MKRVFSWFKDLINNLIWRLRKMTCKSREDCDAYFYDPLGEIEARNRRMDSYEYYDEIAPDERISEYLESMTKAREEKLNAAAENNKDKS